MTDILDTYSKLLARGDPFWASTRALTIKWASSLDWPGQVLEIGGQNGIVASLIGKPVDLMVDSKLDICVPFYKNVMSGDAEHLDIPDSSFDTVVMLNTIYHTDRSKVLSECHRVMRKGGLLLITDCPGYGDILTWPTLLNSARLTDMANKWGKKEFEKYKVNLVPGTWWKDVSSTLWETLILVRFASVKLCHIGRAWQTVNQVMVGDGVAAELGVPKVNGIFLQAVNLALQVYRLPEYLTYDSEMCYDQGSVFVFIALRKR